MPRTKRAYLFLWWFGMFTFMAVVIGGSGWVLIDELSKHVRIEWVNYSFDERVEARQ